MDMSDDVWQIDFEKWLPAFYAQKKSLDIQRFMLSVCFTFCLVVVFWSASSCCFTFRVVDVLWSAYGCIFESCKIWILNQQKPEVIVWCSAKTYCESLWSSCNQIFMSATFYRKSRFSNFWWFQQSKWKQKSNQIESALS